MDELTFTWRSALKLFAGLVLFGVWLLSRQQAKLDESEKKTRAEAQKNGTPIPQRRIIYRSNFQIVALAILFLVIYLFLGNKSTI